MSPADPRFGLQRPHFSIVSLRHPFNIGNGIAVKKKGTANISHFEKPVKLESIGKFACTPPGDKIYDQMKKIV